MEGRYQNLKFVVSDNRDPERSSSFPRGTQLVATKLILSDCKDLIFNTSPHKCPENSEVGKSHLCCFQHVSLPLQNFHEATIHYDTSFGPGFLSGILKYCLLSNFSPHSKIIGPGAIPAGLALGWVMHNIKWLQC